MHFLEFIFDLFFTWCTSSPEPKNKKLKKWHKFGNKVVMYVFFPITIALVLWLICWLV